MKNPMAFAFTPPPHTHKSPISRFMATPFGEWKFSHILQNLEFVLQLVCEWQCVRCQQTDNTLQSSGQLYVTFENTRLLVWFLKFHASEALLQLLLPPSKHCTRPRNSPRLTVMYSNNKRRKKKAYSH